MVFISGEAGSAERLNSECYLQRSMLMGLALAPVRLCLPLLSLVLAAFNYFHLQVGREGEVLIRLSRFNCVYFCAHII